MYTDSLNFLDNVRGSSDDRRFAKDRIFNSLLFGPFLKSQLTQLAFLVFRLCIYRQRPGKMFRFYRDCVFPHTSRCVIVLLFEIFKG
jgi:hypothetical protein